MERVRNKPAWHRQAHVDTPEPPDTRETEGQVNSLQADGSAGKLKKAKSKRLFEARKTLSLGEVFEVQEFSRTLSRPGPLRSLTVDSDRSVERPEGAVTRTSFIKHNKTFHKLFQDIPDTEHLSHAFTCALQKEVLYHGKLYVSSYHVCFYSSVLLKETKVVIPVSDVHWVKKQNTALLVPNALSIHMSSTEKYLFVSLRNREACYKLLCAVCPRVGNENGSPSSSPDSSMRERGRAASSSLEDSFDQTEEIHTDLQRTGETLCDGDSSSREQEVSSSEESIAGHSWVWTATERVKSLLNQRESSNLNVLLLIYLILVLLLLLSSGYIGLRIVALEEQLSSMGALPQFTLQGGYKDT